MILGITGAIGHGKSSLAEAFLKAQPQALHLETYKLVAEVSDAWHQHLAQIPAVDDYTALNEWLGYMPNIIQTITHKSANPAVFQLDAAQRAANPAAYQKLLQHLQILRGQPSLSHQVITDANKEIFRPILQWIGSYLVTEVSPTIWYDELVHRARQALVKGTPLIVIGGVRYPSDAETLRQAGGIIIEIQRPNQQLLDLEDATENQRTQIVADTTIINDASLPDLARCADAVLQDLTAHRLQQTYTASNFR
jgi:hypothetical protein